MLYRWIVLKKLMKVLTQKEQGLPASDPYKSVKSESHALAEPNEKKI